MVFLGVYRAIYDYNAQSEEELEIKDGDLLFVLEKSSDDDWWKAKKKAASEEEDEPEGLVPNNYMEEAKVLYQAKALYDYTKQTDEELSFREEQRVEVYDTSDPDWTLVGSGGEFGFAPANYLEAASSATVASPHSAPAAPPMPTRPQALAAADDDGPLPGEADYPDPGQGPTPSPEPAATNPAASLAQIISQRTGGGGESAPAQQRQLASPPLPSRPQYTPEESEEDDAPSLPTRPRSQALPSPPPTQQYAPSPPPQQQYAPSPRISEPPGVLPSPPYNRASHRSYDYDDEPMRSPGGFHLYNIHEMVSHMGKNKKMPTTLGINVPQGKIMISPEKARDGVQQEWTAEKLTHYSIEGKHVFIELLRPSKSVDFHAGAKDTAQEIVAQLGELAGAVRQEGLREVLAASAGTGAGGLKKGVMLYEFMAQGEDEVTVAIGDEVIVMDDVKSDEWWQVKRMKNGKEGVVPSSYVEITGTIKSGPDSITGLNAARSTVEQNRMEEERLAKEAAKRDKAKRSADTDAIPERGSSLAGENRRREPQRPEKRGSRDAPPKSKPNSHRVRTWTDRSGTFKVEAEFIGLREGKIHLHKMNGVKIAVPVTKMAVEDLEYVERATGQSLDEDKPLSDIKRRNTQKKAKEDDRADRAAKKSSTNAGAVVQKADDERNEYWFNFFLECGVNPQICERYASAFSRDQMSEENLQDVNEQLLRTLGLKEGDILRVMKSLDNRFGRHRGGAGGLPPIAAQPTGAVQDPDAIEPANGGGLFSGPGGALRNNTRKGRPAPAVQTNDTVDPDAFREKTASPAPREPPAKARETALTSAPARQPTSGFDDDAWDVKPARTQTPSTPAPAAEPSRPAEPPRPKVNADIAGLDLLTPPLQPTQAPASAPAAPQQPQQTAQPPAQPPKPQGADQAIFDKIASLAPHPTGAPQQQQQQMSQFQQTQPTGFQQPQQTGYQRPQPPMQQQTNGALGIPPPPRASSAPGFPQQSTFGPPPLQPQMTGGYQQQGFQAPQGQSLQNLQNQQQFQQMQQQATAFPYQQQQQPNGFMQPAQQTSVQAVQQNYPALQPQPTGFIPQSQFGQSQFGGAPQQPTYQQQLVNGSQTGSPFADPPRQPFQPTPSGLSNSFAPQQTGFQQQQPSFNISQPTGVNGYGAQPQMPPQQTGGVFGPGQQVGGGQMPAPLVPQKTGPPPPVRFGVQPAAKRLVSQPTGRANLANATPQNPFGF